MTNARQMEDYWKKCVLEWYPELLERTYFLPPLHFNRVPYSTVTVAGESILVQQDAAGGANQTPSSNPPLSGTASVSAGGVLQKKTKGPQNANLPSSTKTAIPLCLPPVSDSDVRDDSALNRVLHCLRELANNSCPREVMMVVSQLQFGQYLHKPAYEAAASLLPRPRDLGQSSRQGDFDILIIHSRYGLITGEIKSVGANFGSLQTMTDKEKKAVVAKRVMEATKQLNKAEIVLKHLVSDFTGVNVTKLLIMPNVNRRQLLISVRTCIGAQQDLCQCLGVSDVTQAVDLCLCQDDLSARDTPWTVSQQTLREISRWWHQIVNAGSKTPFDPEQYIKLIARFCGPATTVEVHCITPPRLEVKTMEEGVLETGQRLARFILFPEQVELLNRSEPRMFLVGPPGTGKTVLLLLQGLSWMQRGLDIHVVSTWNKSRAAAFLLESQLTKTLQKWTGRGWPTRGQVRRIPRVHRHMFDFGNLAKENVVQASTSLLQTATSAMRLCVLADEAGPDDDNSLPFTQFCHVLLKEVPSIFLWAASLQRRVRPKTLREFVTTIPLRCPPVVIREVEEAGEIRGGDVQHYISNQLVVATDGPPVIRLTHGDSESGHTEDLPDDCEQCGREVADVLKELHVNQTVTGSRTTNPALLYSDVFLLCESPRDDRKDSDNHVTSSANAFIRSLRDSGVPVRVVEYWCDDDAIRDMVLAKNNQVTVTHWDCVRGLEKKVVFVMVDSYQSHRLHGVSRCTAQLVVSTGSVKQGQNQGTNDASFWLKIIREWYPDLHNKTYFLPPLHITITKSDVENLDPKIIMPLTAESVPDENALLQSTLNIPQSTIPTNAIIPSPPSNKVIYKDLKRVLLCLSALADNSDPRQVMVVLSRLQFGQYSRKPCFAAASAFLSSPTKWMQTCRKRDCDILIIHSQYGLIAGEVKSVGHDFDKGSPPGKNDAVVVASIQDAVKQLNKAEDVLKHLVSDLSGVNVIKTLLLPNVESKQLSRVIGQYATVAQDLCQCLGVKDIAKVVDTCLCAEQLSPDSKPSDISEQTLKELSSWWRHLTLLGTQSPITRDKYEQLVARFCVPSSAMHIHCITSPLMELRKDDENIDETGERIANLVLFPEQFDLLNTSPKHVFLIGPPGTGKTVTLILQGLKWLQRGHDVHIVSTWNASLAVSFLIEHQLRKTIGMWFSGRSEKMSQIRRHHYDFENFDNVHAAVKLLLEEANAGKQLFVLADEVGPDDEHFTGRTSRPSYAYSESDYDYNDSYDDQQTDDQDYDYDYDDEHDDDQDYDQDYDDQYDDDQDYDQDYDDQHDDDQDYDDEHDDDQDYDQDYDDQHDDDQDYDQDYDDQHDDDQDYDQDYDDQQSDDQDYDQQSDDQDYDQDYDDQQSDDQDYDQDYDDQQSDDQDYDQDYDDQQSDDQDYDQDYDDQQSDDQDYDQGYDDQQSDDQDYDQDYDDQQSDDQDYDDQHDDDQDNDDQYDDDQNYDDEHDDDQDYDDQPDDDQNYDQDYDDEHDDDQYYDHDYDDQQNDDQDYDQDYDDQQSDDQNYDHDYDYEHDEYQDYDQDYDDMYDDQQYDEPDYESDFDDMEDYDNQNDYNDANHPFTEFCNMLIQALPAVCIWGSAIKSYLRPLCLSEVALTTPLRSPQTIVREVDKSLGSYHGKMHQYSVNHLLTGTVGQQIKTVIHVPDGQSGHTTNKPEECIKCGQEIAHILKDLQIGQNDDGSHLAHLRYYDVLVLCNSMHDDQLDSNGHVTSPASGLICGLRECDVPVRIVDISDENAVRQTALRLRDEVTVTHWNCVRGLERKVVIEIEVDTERHKNVLHGTSRCSGQLIRIKNTEDVNLDQTKSNWVECIRLWYPDLQNRTYFLPPLHFNRIRYTMENVVGKSVLVSRMSVELSSESATPSPPRPEDLKSSALADVERDDRAFEHIVLCLRALAERLKEVMMVISRLQFDHYLNKTSHAAATALLPKPSNLPDQFQVGGFDVLIIHRTLGLLVGEIRLLDTTFNDNESDAQKDMRVVKNVKRAVKQLNTAEVVLKHLVSDLQGVRVVKVLLMPDTESATLLRILESNVQVAKNLCQCLDVSDVINAVELSLTADKLSARETPWDIPDSTMTILSNWWQKLTGAGGLRVDMAPALYETLVSRFCGPATTVDIECATPPHLEIRTEGEAVSETGERMIQCVLLPKQIELLNTPPPLAFLVGPPGTGKTTVLLMQGLTWVRAGHDVHIVSTWTGSLAASLSIEHQLLQFVKERCTESPGNIHLHLWRFDSVNDDMKTAVNLLSESVLQGGQLCVLADEAVHSNNGHFTQFSEMLIVAIPTVYLWASSMYHCDRPSNFKEVTMTTPLRSPPVVTRVVLEASEIVNNSVYNYSTRDFPAETDGPPLRRLKHRDGYLGHNERWPENCDQCGRDVANVLTELRVGLSGTTVRPPPLKHRDVLILCDNPGDDKMDTNGQVTTTAVGLVRGLRACHVPVRVVDDPLNIDAVRDLVLAVSDAVTVTNRDIVRGLERKIVVVASSDVHFRLLAASRCTSLLVLIESCIDDNSDAEALSASLSTFCRVDAH